MPGLTLQEFIKYGRVMFRDYAADDNEGDGGITTDHASLAMMSYRRQRMLSDMRDPIKRARLALALAPVETKRRWSALTPSPPPAVEKQAAILGRRGSCIDRFQRRIESNKFEL